MVVYQTMKTKLRFTCFNTTHAYDGRQTDRDSTRWDDVCTSYTIWPRFDIKQQKSEQKQVM